MTTVMTKRPRLQLDLDEDIKRAIVMRASLLGIGPNELVTRWAREKCSKELAAIHEELGTELKPETDSKSSGKTRKKSQD